MNRNIVIAITAITLWLTSLVRLLPLPPDEVAHYVQLFQRSLAEPPESLPNWNDRPEREKQFVIESWKNTEKEMRSYISTAKEQESSLWTLWAARLCFITFAIVGWLLFAMQKSKWLILVTTLLLVPSYLLRGSAVYTEYFHLWQSGRILFPYLSWQFTAFNIYHFFAMPFLLCILTIVAFVKKNSPHAT